MIYSLLEDTEIMGEEKVRKIIYNIMFLQFLKAFCDVIISTSLF